MRGDSQGVRMEGSGAGWFTGTQERHLPISTCSREGIEVRSRAPRTGEGPGLPVGWR